MCNAAAGLADRFAGHEESRDLPASSDARSAQPRVTRSSIRLPDTPELNVAAIMKKTRRATAPCTNIAPSQAFGMKVGGPRELCTLRRDSKHGCRIHTR